MPLLIVAVVVWVWLANHVPIVQGSSLFGTARSDVRQIEIDAFDLSGYVFEVPTGRAATFRYRFSIRNDGPFAVTIRHVAAHDGDGPARVTRRAVRIDTAPLSGPIAYQPWHPFTLDPGDEATLEMQATYEGMCMARGDALSWNREPVTFSVLGVTRHEDVMVGVEVRFVGTGDC